MSMDVLLRGILALGILQILIVHQVWLNSPQHSLLTLTKTRFQGNSIHFLLRSAKNTGYPEKTGQNFVGAVSLSSVTPGPALSPLPPD